MYDTSFNFTIIFYLLYLSNQSNTLISIQASWRCLKKDSKRICTTTRITEIDYFATKLTWLLLLVCRNNSPPLTKQILPAFPNFRITKLLTYLLNLDICFLLCYLAKIRSPPKETGNKQVIT